MLPSVSNANTDFEVISEIQRAKFEVFIAYNFGGRIWGSNTNFRGRKGALFLLYLPDRILYLQCLLTFNN